MNRYQQTGHGLGTDIVITINDTKPVDDKIFIEIWSLLRTFENRFSRFIPESEITKVSSAHGSPVRVSSEFITLLQRAIQLSTQTSGTYNPLLLGNLQHAGYKGSWPNVDLHNSELDFSTRTEVVAAETIVVTDSTVQIPANTALDFGGIGKGYVLDLIADLLDSKHVKDYWVSLGGDIVVRGHDVTGKPWNIGIGSATDTDHVIASLQNHNGARVAVATSGITKRNGSNWHHLIDPTTGKPADTDVLSATVCHPLATTADVLAKCIVILGSHKTKQFADNNGALRVVSQLESGDTLQYEVDNV